METLGFREAERGVGSVEILQDDSFVDPGVVAAVGQVQGIAVSPKGIQGGGRERDRVGADGVEVLEFAALFGQGADDDGVCGSGYEGFGGWTFANDVIGSFQ